MHASLVLLGIAAIVPDSNALLMKYSYNVRGRLIRTVAAIVNCVRLFLQARAVTDM